MLSRDGFRKSTTGHSCLSGGAEAMFDWIIPDMCPFTITAEATMALLADGVSSLLIDGLVEPTLDGRFALPRERSAAPRR